MFTAAQRLQRVRVALLRDAKWRHLSGLLLMGKHEISDKYPTAATNGRDVFYSEEMVNALSDHELRGVVLHEVFHIMYKHLIVWKHLYKENPIATNMACDYVINLQILDAGEVLPQGEEYKGLVDRRFEGMDTKQVYDILVKEGTDSSSSFDFHDWDSAQEMSPKEVEGLQREIDRAMREGVLAAQAAGAGVPRGFQDLLTPKINWREALREYIKGTLAGKGLSSWERPNRRFLHSGIYLPTQKTETLGTIVVAVDTSGSVADEEMREFLSEVQGVATECAPSRLDILYWGTNVVGHEKYEGDEVFGFAGVTKPISGGGTNVTRVFEFIDKEELEPECVIVLTDGYTPWPDSYDKDVLFVMSSQEIAPFGKTVHL